MAFSNVTVWVLPGTTSVGNETNMGLWTQVATGSGTGAGVGLPTHVNLSNPISLNAGTLYGIAILADSSFGFTYTNGTGANQTYSDGNLSLALGSATNVPFTAPVFSPRVWNGTIYYDGLCGTPSPTGTATATQTATNTPTASPTSTPPPSCPATITQSTSQTVVPGSVACTTAGVGSTQNSYWRAFTLSDFGVPAASTYNVSSVSFGVETVTTSLPITVNLYTTTGFPTGFPGSLTLIGTAMTTITTVQGGTVVSVPLAASVPPGTSQLVMEVNAPDGTPSLNFFFIGSNTAAETGPSYLSAADCGITTPTTTAAIGFPNMHIIMNVNGSCPTGGTPTPTSTGTPLPTATSTATATATPTATPGAGCDQNFDGVTAPALPAGWTTTASGVESPWVTTTAMSSSAPNSAFAPDPNNVGDTEIVSPAMMISAGGGSFSFQNNYLTESTFDGMVLEISVNGGAYQDILAAGGSFVTGGYNATISVNFMSPIAGRMAWSGNSGGFITTTVNLPASANGQSIQLKWRMASDSSIAATGVWVDSITGIPCGNGTPTPTATATATSTPSVSPSTTPTPGMVSVQWAATMFPADESQDEPATITRTGDLSGTTTVMFSTTDGTAHGGAAANGTGCSVNGVDYILVTNQPVTFNPGESSKTVLVTICGDTIVEPTETINLVLTGANVGSPGTAVMNVNDTANLFRNTAAICTSLGTPGAPYPSNITIANGPVQIGGMRVTFYDVSHVFPDNIDALLVSPSGRTFVLMGDAGGSTAIDPNSPVTLTFADAAGQVLPDSAALTTGLFEPTNWETPVTDFLAPAPAGPYNEPGSAVGGSGSQTFMGNFGLMNANGVWSLYIRDDGGVSSPSAITGCINGGWGIDFLTSTAANSSISGRVLTADGRGIRNARVTISGNALTEPRIATTGSFGYFSFDGLAAGETYVVTVNSQRYTFTAPSRVISLVDNVVDADFVAEP